MDLRIDAPISMRARLVHYWWRVRNKLGLVKCDIDITGQLSCVEGTYLHGLAGALQPGQRIVEIGAYLGRSTAYIASALRPGVEFYTIDLWIPNLPPESGPPPIDQDTFARFQRNISPWKDSIKVIRGRSEDVGRAWNPGAVDLCFIDGDHSYEGVRRDIVAWLPHCATGCMCFHDYTQPTCGVKRAVDELFVPAATRLRVIQSILSGRVNGSREEK